MVHAAGMRHVLIALVMAACGGPQPPGVQGSQNDADRDGVRDIDDKCAYEPGPGTPDGCPEKKSEIQVLEGDHAAGSGAPVAPAADVDTDKDGIRDADDLCPKEPEDKDGDKDEDGCPER